MARYRHNQHAMARVVVLTLAAAAFVALIGLPAQAQVYYTYPYSPNYYSPYYGTPYYQNYSGSCQMYPYGWPVYNNCPAQPYTYNNSPYYAPNYTPYTYYYYGPSSGSRSAGARER